jgi:protein SCO1/2
MAMRRGLWASVALVAIGTGLSLFAEASRATPPGSDPLQSDQARPPAPDFDLIDQDGHPARIVRSGKPTVLTFGYTSCPEFCPLILGQIRKALIAAGAVARDTAVVEVTVDPERDTVPYLSRYAKAWPAGWSFLTGPTPRVARAWNAYSVVVDKGPVEGGDYTVTHSGKVVLIDRQGRRAGELAGDWTPAQLASALDRMEASTGRVGDGPVLTTWRELLRRCGAFASANPVAFGLVVLLLALPGLVIPISFLVAVFAHAEPRTEAKAVATYHLDER